MTSGRRVLVTGGTGFLGRRVVPLLVARGDAVGCLTRSEAAADAAVALGAEAIAGDLDDRAALTNVMSWAAGGSLVNIASLGFGHAGGIVAAAEAAGVDRAVFVSTTAITTTLAATAKAVRVEAEEVVRRSSLRWTIIRPTMIYGAADDRNMHRLLSLLRRVPVVPVPGGGKRLQQPVHVEDVADALVSALDREGSVGHTYDIAGPDPLTLREIVRAAAEALGRDVRILSVPLAPALWAARAYERLARRPRLKAEQIERLAEDKAFDISPARRDLAYAPRAFREGIGAQARSTWPP